MATFMYIFRGGAFLEPGLSPAELQAHLLKWRSWVGALAKAGHARDGGPPIRMEGRVVRDRAVTDGPYAESKDLVTGNLIVEAASLDQAAELARDCPIFEFTGTVEVRPILPRE